MGINPQSILSVTDMKFWAEEEVTELVIQACDIIGCYEIDGVSLNLPPEYLDLSISILSLIPARLRSLGFCLWKRKQISKRRKVAQINLLIQKRLSELAKAGITEYVAKVNTLSL